MEAAIEAGQALAERQGWARLATITDVVLDRACLDK
jgi:hypothetical protein